MFVCWGQQLSRLCTHLELELPLSSLFLSLSDILFSFMLDNFALILSLGVLLVVLAEFGSKEADSRSLVGVRSITT